MLRLLSNKRHIADSIRFFSQNIQVSEAVRNALQKGSGVVALESTVITHGLPYPQNLETARLLEEKVKESGSTPATIALINGKIHVGLTNEELSLIASDKNSVKVSTRDIAKCLIKKEIGGTTVASTMRIANEVGIKVFATGGIGGVHRGVEETFDISADLQELSRTPVCVVCSGVKSILDIPKTIEYMETHSINCVVYGNENIFPNFFTRKSECKGQFNTNDLIDVVKLMKAAEELRLNNGLVLACPIPEEYETNGHLIQSAIMKSLTEIREKNITSQNVTPFILSRVNELTKGESMKTNIALLANNAKIAGELASKWSRPVITSTHAKRTKDANKNQPNVVSIGAVIVDYEAISNEDIKNDGGSYPGHLIRRVGGVARNHCDSMARLGCHSSLISAIGNDENGKFFRDQSSHMDIRRVKIVDNAPTCTYMAVNVRGNVRFGISTCEPLLHGIKPSLIHDNEELIKDAEFVLLDGNMPMEVVGEAVKMANRYNKRVWYEPTDINKVHKIFESGGVDGIFAASPNANEFKEWVKYSNTERLDDEMLCSPERILDYIQANKSRLLRNMDMLVVTLAQHGSVVVHKNKNGQMEYDILAAPCQPNDIISVSGAGDSFNGGMISGIVNNLPMKQCFEIAQKCASATLQSQSAVSMEINERLLQ